MQHHASRTLIDRSLWERKLTAGFPSLDRFVRFFVMVGFYSVVCGAVVWSCIFILWALVMVAGGPAPMASPDYI